MLELNKWFFAQLANFLLLLIALNIILFRPILRLFRERDKGINGALEDAKAMDQEKDGLLATIDAKILAARTQAKGTFEQASREGMEVQKQALSAAQQEASVMNSKAKAELEASLEKARASLKSDIETFSRQIVEKLIRV